MRITSAKNLCGINVILLLQEEYFLPVFGTCGKEISEGGQQYTLL